MNTEKIIQKIKENNLKPKSKYLFMLKKILTWILLITTTVFGSYAFAFLFLKLFFIDFQYWYLFSDSYDKFIFYNLPLIWIALFIISLYLISYLFTKTSHGYRYSLFVIGVISIFISMFLGVFLAKYIANTDSLIHNLEKERKERWYKPRSGLLLGEIILKEDKYLLLQDTHNKLWNINIENILNDSKQVLVHDQPISVIGMYQDDKYFTACQILPFNTDEDNIFDIDDSFVENDTEIAGIDTINQYNSRVIKEICDFVINTK